MKKFTNVKMIVDLNKITEQEPVEFRDMLNVEFTVEHSKIKPVLVIKYSKEMNEIEILLSVPHPVSDNCFGTFRYTAKNSYKKIREQVKTLIDKDAYDKLIEYIDYVVLKLYMEISRRNQLDLVFDESVIQRIMAKELT